MTYDELRKIIAANNLYTSNEWSSPTGTMGGEQYYLSDPNNPLGTSVQQGDDGSLFGWTPRDAQTGQGGGDFVAYGPDGQLVNQGFRENTKGWRDSLFGAVGTLGGAALLGNAGALLGAAGGTGGTGATAATSAAANGAWDVLPAAVGGSGGAGGAAGAAGAAGASQGIGGMFGEGGFDPGQTMYAGGTPGFYDTGIAAGGAMPGDIPPGIVGADGGIDWGKLSQAASGAGGISQFLAQNPGLAKLLPGLAGGVLGAIGSGPQTTTTTESQSINDPAYQQFRDDTFNTLRGAASQPYAAPGFSLTQDPNATQLGAIDQLTGFANGSRDVRSATNPLATENNPYITGAISAGARDMTDAYARMVAPTYAGASSFGNRNMGEYENADRSNLMMRIGDLSNTMRMQDHNLRATLLESGAGRADAMGNANANRGLGAANSLFGAGSALWGQGQQNIANQYAEFTRGQNWQRQGAQLMQGGLNAPYNRTATSSSTTPGNRAAGALGGFTLGMQAGGLFNGQPMGGQTKSRTAASLFG